VADFFSIIQPAVGLVLFVACGWSLTMALFRDEDIDVIERAAFALAFALVIPAMVLIFLNLVLQIKVGTALVFAVYALLAVGGWAYAEKFRQSRRQAS